MLELIARLDARSKTPRSMPYDSSTAKIVRRLQDHETKTLPVIAKYSQRHEVVRIDGTGTFDDVYSRLSAVVEDGLRRLR
jgi:adenylate kinase